MRRHKTDAATCARITAAAKLRYDAMSPIDRLAFRDAQRCRAHGITSEQAAAMLGSQGYRCAICETDAPGKRRSGEDNWHIDHDHKSGAVRGLLCSTCNYLLGMAKDDEHILFAAAEYLIEHRLPASRRVRHQI